MTERQYNSKLLTDKLTSVPVPAGDALWSKIEAQLLTPPPQPEGPKGGNGTGGAGVAKGGLVKMIAVIFSSIILVIFVIWMVNKLDKQKKATPPPAKKRQTQVMDKSKLPAPVTTPVQPPPQLPAPVQPARNNRQMVTEEPARQDTATTFTTTRNRHMPVYLHPGDSLQTVPKATIQPPPDTAKLVPHSLPPKKEEVYYFNIKSRKAKGDSTP